MKLAFYAAAVVGLLGIAAGVYWDFLKGDHHTRGLVALIVGVVLLIGGLVASFVVKPKAPATN
jgi:hypothetical protein